MKKSILCNLIGLFVFFVACDPIEKRDKLGPIVPTSEFEYTITQNPEMDYVIYLENKTPKVLFSWDYAWDITTRQKDTVHILVPGEYKIKITATTPGGIVFDEHEIIVTMQDPDAFPEPEWEMLTNFAEGKSWSWDLSVPSPAGNGGYKGCTQPCWWMLNAAELEEQGVLNDYMIFDLNGGKHLTLVSESKPKAGETKGTFDLDMNNKIEGWSVGTLTTQNVIVPFGWDPNNDDLPFHRYDILKISEDQLQLSASQPGTGDWGEAWFYMFAPKE